MFVVRRGHAELELDAANALEGLLGHDAVGRHQVGDDPENHRLDAGHEQDTAQHDRLDVT